MKFLVIRSEPDYPLELKAFNDENSAVKEFKYEVIQAKNTTKQREIYFYEEHMLVAYWFDYNYVYEDLSYFPQLLSTQARLKEVEEQIKEEALALAKKQQASREAVEYQEYLKLKQKFETK